MPPDDQERAVYVLLRPELGQLHETLTRHFADDSGVEVVLERRRRRRRGGGDRRRVSMPPPNGVERRIAPDLEGRRLAERRRPLVSVEDPRLPPELRPVAASLDVVRDPVPASLDRDFARVRDLASAWRNRCAEVVREAREGTSRNRSDGVEALVAALAARDSYVSRHSAEVVPLAVDCARRIGFDGRMLAEVEEVALLHDIGKLGIPDTILNKTGPLEPVEWSIMRMHPLIGAQIIHSVETLRHLGRAVRAEHERWDGGGYPDGLAGEEIPLPSRIVFVCDAYHAMISDRPYRKALSAETARQELERNLGTQFWPAAGEALLTMLSGTPDAA